ncbi:MAG: hypothetical protein AAF726_10975 [Planctomycetota bacterium]
MRIEPQEDEGIDDFVVVEDGEYGMRVAEVRESTNPERTSWMLRLELLDGERAGRTAATDWLNFTTKGMHRVRIVLGALGFDVSEPLEVEAHELVGRTASVRLATAESVRESDGRLQRRSRVTYDGWAPHHAREAAPTAGGSTGGTFAADEMPF